MMMKKKLLFRRKKSDGVASNSSNNSNNSNNNSSKKKNKSTSNSPASSPRPRRGISSSTATTGRHSPKFTQSNKTTTTTTHLAIQQTSSSDENQYFDDDDVSSGFGLPVSSPYHTQTLPQYPLRTTANKNTNNQAQNTPVMSNSNRKKSSPTSPTPSSRPFQLPSSTGPSRRPCGADSVDQPPQPSKYHNWPPLPPPKPKPQTTPMTTTTMTVVPPPKRIASSSPSSHQPYFGVVTPPPPKHFAPPPPTLVIAKPTLSSSSSQKPTPQQQMLALKAKSSQRKEQELSYLNSLSHDELLQQLRDAQRVVRAVLGQTMEEALHSNINLNDSASSNSATSTASKPLNSLKAIRKFAALQRELIDVRQSLQLEIVQRQEIEHQWTQVCLERNELLQLQQQQQPDQDALTTTSGLERQLLLKAAAPSNHPPLSSALIQQHEQHHRLQHQVEDLKLQLVEKQSQISVLEDELVLAKHHSKHSTSPFHHQQQKQQQETSPSSISRRDLELELQECRAEIQELEQERQYNMSEIVDLNQQLVKEQEDHQQERLELITRNEVLQNQLEQQQQSMQNSIHSPPSDDRPVGRASPEPVPSIEKKQSSSSFGEEEQEPEQEDAKDTTFWVDQIENLEQQCVEYQRQVQEWQGQVEEWQTMATQRSEVCQAWSKQNKELQEKVQKQEAQICELQDKIAASKSQHSPSPEALLRRASFSSRDKNDNNSDDQPLSNTSSHGMYQKMLVDLQGKMESLANELTEMKQTHQAELQTWKDRVQEQESLVQERKHQVEELQSKVNQQEEELRLKQEEIQKQQEERQEEKEAMDADSKDKNDDNMLEKGEEGTNDVPDDENITSMPPSGDELDLQMQLRIHRATVSKLQVELVESKLQIEELLKTRQGSNNNNDQQRAAMLEQAKTRIQQLEQELAASSHSKASKEDKDENAVELSQLQAMLQATQQQLSAREQDYSLIYDQFVELQSRLQLAQTEVEELEMERNFHAAKVFELNKLILSRDETNTVTQGENGEEDDESLSREIVIKDPLHAKALECAELTTRLTMAEQQLELVQGQLVKVEQERQVSRDKVAELSAIWDSQDKIEEARDELQQTVERVAGMLRKSQGRVEQLERERDVSVSKASKLSMDLATTRQELDEVMGQWDVAKKELEEYQEREQQQEVDNAEAQTSMDHSDKGETPTKASSGASPPTNLTSPNSVSGFFSNALGFANNASPKKGSPSARRIMALEETVSKQQVMIAQLKRNVSSATASSMPVPHEENENSENEDAGSDNAEQNGNTDNGDAENENAADNGNDDDSSSQDGAMSMSSSGCLSVDMMLPLEEAQSLTIQHLTQKIESLEEEKSKQAHRISNLTSRMEEVEHENMARSIKIEVLEQELHEKEKLLPAVVEEGGGDSEEGEEEKENVAVDKSMYDDSNEDKDNSTKSSSSKESKTKESISSIYKSTMQSLHVELSQLRRTLGGAVRSSSTKKEEQQEEELVEYTTLKWLTAQPPVQQREKQYAVDQEDCYSCDDILLDEDEEAERYEI